MTRQGMDPYEAARRIAVAGKALRRISEGWCPRCGKLVAAVVAFDGELWLWTVGGRAGSHASMVAEFERSLDDARAGLAEAEERGSPDLQALSREGVNEFERLLREIHAGRYPAFVPGLARRLTDLHLDKWEYDDVAPCRGCRRDVTLRVLRAQEIIVTPSVALP